MGWRYVSRSPGGPIVPATIKRDPSSLIFIPLPSSSSSPQMESSDVSDFFVRPFVSCLQLLAKLCLSGSFFYLIFFSVDMLLLHYRLFRCSCAVCRAYLSSSWKANFENQIDWFTHLLRQSPTGTVQIHVLRTTITADPSNVEYILDTHFHNFHQGEPFSTVLRELLGQGIFNVDGQQWLSQRNMASLVLEASSVKSNAFNIVSDEIHNRLLPFLDYSNRMTVDLQEVFRRFSFDTICRISFGVDPKYLNLWMRIPILAIFFDSTVELLASRASTRPSVMWKIKRILRIGSEKKLRKYIRILNEAALEIISDHRNGRVSQGQDILSHFMATVQDELKLRDIIFNFLLSGRDTVAVVLTTFFLLLSSNPAAETAILEEISRVLNGGSVPSSEKLREMQYLDAALYECMRLYPPVQYVSKECVDDDVLPDGTIVRAGTTVTYNSYAMGRMEAVWGSDCKDFKPERWLRNGVFRPESPFKLPVFQGGPRDCLGKTMAVMQMKAVIASVLPEYEIQVLGRPPKFANGFTVIFDGEIPALVRKRR